MRRLKPTPDTVWPDPEDLEELEWQLRYGQPTRQDDMNAAAVVAAYRQLCSLTREEAGRTVVSLRRARYALAAREALRSTLKGTPAGDPSGRGGSSV